MFDSCTEGVWRSHIFFGAMEKNLRYQERPFLGWTVEESKFLHIIENDHRTFDTRPQFLVFFMIRTILIWILFVPHLMLDPQ
jgi:hypothetical protein